MSTTTELAVDVSDLTVDRGQVRALSDVSIRVPRGSVTVLLGPNGSGKSTLLLALLGLVRPTRGQVRLLGGSVKAALSSGKVATVGQADGIDEGFPVTARDVVMQGRRPFTGAWRRASRSDRDAVESALDRVDLSDLSGRRINALSGGQRRRILLARCLAQEADLLLLDEPFNGMDAGSEDVYVDVLRELAAQGRTTLVSTHHLDTVDRLADSVALLDGRLVAHGSVAETTTPEMLATLLGARHPHAPAPEPTSTSHRDLTHEVST
ncbi:metal ABC transporter ATP-binding protein [Dietzia aurantiaca]|uniref:metal ABC transporter ATP-binding protein n=1 Tax=Dietzia aurantiaca TaxID=983873 RepID=UPI001E51ADFB|nr:metal ABC transporter ATP-binding protein [Dietzia aurantiaca]MCD2263094.1 metal ABC transporter ATP-binding protein [Dietzia aurantiaca]